MRAARLDLARGIRKRIVYGLPGTGFYEEVDRLLREEGIEIDHRGCVLGPNDEAFAVGYNYVMDPARSSAFWP